MVVTQQSSLPSYEELTVPELTLSSPALKAGSLYLGKYCDTQSKEFMLCHTEELDPRRCLKEGAEVTRCGVEFFNKVRLNCMQEFTQFWQCMDRTSQDLPFYYCKKPQAVYNQCMKDKLGMEKPPIGYFSRVRIHESLRPKPQVKDVEMPMADPEPPNVDDHPESLPTPTGSGYF